MLPGKESLAQKLAFLSDIPAPRVSNDSDRARTQLSKSATVNLLDAEGIALNVAFVPHPF